MSPLNIHLRTSVGVFYALRRCLMSFWPRPGRHFCNVMTPPIPVSLCNDPINISILHCSVSILVSGLWSRLVLAGSFSGSLTLSLMFSSLRAEQSSSSSASPTSCLCLPARLEQAPSLSQLAVQSRVCRYQSESNTRQSRSHLARGCAGE